MNTAVRVTAPLRQARREHRLLLTRLSRADVIWRARTAAPDPSRSGRASVAVQRCASDIVAHLADEERSVYPLLRARLPFETGTLDATLTDHATLRDLVSLLRQRCVEADDGAPEAAPAAGAVLRDLLEVWRLHARRVDRAVAPLLRRLDRESRRD